MQKKQYEKPEIRTEEIEMGSFGQYDPPGPSPANNPQFGICCT